MAYNISVAVGDKEMIALGNNASISTTSVDVAAPSPSSEVETSSLDGAIPLVTASLAVSTVVSTACNDVSRSDEPHEVATRANGTSKVARKRFFKVVS
jgi:hypothetical protein